MRPKSIATVVVFLSRPCDRSSTSVDATVMTASVVHGTISDTEPTKVVLPTPNPPATTILTEVVARRESTLKLVEATQNPLEQIGIRGVVGRSVHQHETGVGQVADEHPGHPERDTQLGCDLGHRSAVGAQFADRLRLRATSSIEAFAGQAGDDQCLE